jgi:hypothetical protein
LALLNGIARFIASFGSGRIEVEENGTVNPFAVIGLSYRPRGDTCVLRSPHQTAANRISGGSYLVARSGDKAVRLTTKRRQSIDLAAFYLVAGTGFEPVTFRL